MISLLSLSSGTEKPFTQGGKSFIPLLNYLLSNLLLRLSLLRQYALRILSRHSLDVSRDHTFHIGRRGPHNMYNLVFFSPCYHVCLSAC
jgi:hypothetical protein